MQLSNVSITAMVIPFILIYFSLRILIRRKVLNLIVVVNVIYKSDLVERRRIEREKSRYLRRSGKENLDNFC